MLPIVDTAVNDVAIAEFHAYTANRRSNRSISDDVASARSQDTIDHNAPTNLPAPTLLHLPEEILEPILKHLEVGSPLEILRNRVAARSANKSLHALLPLKPEDQRRLRFQSFAVEDDQFHEYLSNMVEDGDSRIMESAIKYMSPTQIDNFIDHELSQELFIAHPAENLAGENQLDDSDDDERADGGMMEMMRTMKLRGLLEFYPRASPSNRSVLLDKLENLDMGLPLLYPQLAEISKLPTAAMEAVHSTSEHARVRMLFDRPLSAALGMMGSASLGNQSAIDLLPQARIEQTLALVQQAAPEDREVHQFVASALHRFDRAAAPAIVRSLVEGTRAADVPRILAATIAHWHKLADQNGTGVARSSELQRLILHYVERFIAHREIETAGIAELAAFVPLMNARIRSSLIKRILAIEQPDFIPDFGRAAGRALTRVFEHKHLFSAETISRLIRKGLGSANARDGLAEPSIFLEHLNDFSPTDQEMIARTIGSRALANDSIFDGHALSKLPRKFPLQSETAQDAIVAACFALQERKSIHGGIHGLANAFAHLRPEQQRKVLDILEQGCEGPEKTNGLLLASQMMHGIFPHLWAPDREKWLQRFYATNSSREFNVSILTPIVKHMNAHQHAEYVDQAMKIKKTEHWLRLFQSGRSAETPANAS